MKKLELNIYLNEADMSGDAKLHEVLVRRLLHLEVAGATVMRGLMGYGKHGKVHKKRLFGVSDDRPVVITAIDDDARIRGVLAEVKSLVREGLITIQEVEEI
jgi:uncharacterized protein